MHRKSKESDARKGKVVRLRPANPFDLISLIARTQSDPRKAVAELVQNSLDAGAKSITISRFRRKKEEALSVLDDGAGIFPELPREDALERIATNIGSSFKQNLTPAQRREAMMQGKYGIGILGFWSVGEEMEIRSRVGGAEVWSLRLLRDRPEAGVSRVAQQRVPLAGETWTELVIRRVDEAASRQIGGRRLGDYLGSELRGQLLERKVKLRIIDRVARGKAPKDFLVVPQRFRGRPILKEELPVPGFASARAELYFIEESGDRRPAVALTSGGTIVCPDLAGIDGGDLARAPWSLGCLEGVIEFPDLDVAPASRRGFQPGPGSEALLAAIHGLEPRVLALIGEEREKRNAEEDETVAREIRRAFRPLAHARPQYDFFEIASKDREKADAEGDGGAAIGRASGGGPDEAPEEPETPEDGTEIVDDGDIPDGGPEIIPPGPLESALIAPRKCRVLPGARRDLVARALDADGRRIEEGVEFAWSVIEGAGSIEPRDGRARFAAGETLGPVRIAVEARQGERSARAEAEIEVVDRLAGEKPDAGIPDPKRVFDPSGDWRSRVAGRRWEYNAAHPDYDAVKDEPRRRFRYLVHLFAKEVVLRNYGDAPPEHLLERMVEVLTHIRPRG
jgi:hypothetical protein